MTSKLAQCFLAWSKGKQRYEGPVSDEAIDKVIGAADSKAKFARESHAYDRDLSLETPLHLNEAGLDWFSKYTGVDVRQLGAYFRDPAALLGDDVVQSVHEIYLAHRASGGDRTAWTTSAKPMIQQIRARVEASLQPNRLDYAKRYFDHHEAGGSMYPPPAEFDPLMTPIRNAVGNLVSFSPLITIQNGFEFLPKAMSHASMSGQSPTAVFKAFGSLMQKTGGKPFSKLADWDARGIYGTMPEPKPWDYLGKSETLLRNLSASLGEVLGQAPELAVEKVAFVPRMGNEMQAYWTTTGRNSVTLMRYSIAATKMYMNMGAQLALGVRNGDMAQAGRAATALAAFSVMAAIQTGGESAIPAPVGFILKKADPDTYEMIREMDEQMPGLKLSKYLGLDIAEKSQPLMGAAFGLGYTIASQDIKGGLTSLGKVPMDLSEGELGLAGARLVESVMGVGQLARIPGVNLTTKRMASAVVKQLEEEGEINADMLQRTGDSLGLINP